VEDSVLVDSPKEGEMAITRWSPFAELDSMERRMRRTFEELGLAPALVPAADVYETDDEFIVELEVPGYDEEELTIEVSDHTLTVKGERTETKEKAEKTFRRHERLEREFERHFVLPAEADSDRLAARFAKGVLAVHAPKVDTARTRKVEIVKA
jgi:HSP20 family protein